MYADLKARLQDFKVESNDRVFVLEPFEGKAPINTLGSPDKRLFTGENKLHAIQETNGLWSLKMDSGILPQPLQQQFTNFHKLTEFVTQYYQTRNVRVKEILS